MFYPRKIFPSLLGHLEKKQVTVITGMRRTGKTTLVKELLASAPSDNKLYIDLERIDNRELFSFKNYDNVLVELNKRGLDAKKKIYIAIDEIQLLPNVVSVIKYLYDHFDIKFLVTGSSSYYLKNLFSESLAGRKQIFELFPLDFREFLDFKQVRYGSDNTDWKRQRFDRLEFERIRSYYDEFVVYGGFPEVALGQTASDKLELSKDIINSYLNIDVKTLSDFRDEKNIYNLIMLLASRAGTRLDYSKLASVSGLSRQTVLSYVDLFEKTYLLSRVSVFTKNRDKEIVKAQKLYFCDNGLLNVLAEVGSGVQFQNAVFNQIRHKGEVRYYALKTGREIDFVFNGDLAMEAKETPALQDKLDLSDLSDVAGIKNSVLVGRHESRSITDYIWGGAIK